MPLTSVFKLLALTPSTLSVPVAADVTTGFPVAQFQVQDTNPVWVYCKQTGHCSQGMVFAINPGTQMAAFQAAAIATGNATNATTTSSSVTSSATSSSTSTAQSVDHTVVVGGTGKIFYSPSNITANPGDTVTFQFQQKNHTVTQSSFATPCRALASTSTTGQVGFDSGFMPVADNATTFPTYTIQVNDTSPIWAYCKQTAHCGEGMVFSVNSNEASTNNFAAFLNNAKTQNGSATTTSTSSSSSSTSSASGASSRHTASRSIVGAAVTLGAFAIGLML